MTPEQLRAVIASLEARVTVAVPGPPPVFAFAAPTALDLARLGVDAAEARRLLEAPWWPEMVVDILETPSFCAAEEKPETALRYARDVVSEYVRKRFSLTP
jgi:hypothetical protein